MKTFICKTLLILSIFAAAASQKATACDCCVCPTPWGDFSAHGGSGFYFHVGEQFTHFGTLRLDGRKVDNPTGQYLNSSITHLVAGATFLDNRLAVQVNVPLISRKFKRPEGFDIEHGSEAGLGDVSLLLSYQLFRKESGIHESAAPSAKNAKAVVLRGEPDFTTSLNLLAGLKFPTGDSSRLKEEFEEHEVPGAPVSGIHGHDLALGSGSWDGIFGLESFTRYKNLFLQLEVQYAVRGPGKHSYRFANDLTWEGGPGVYLKRDGANSIALQALLSGESKGKDTFNGEQAIDTGVTALYIGPRLLATFGKWSADVGCGWPVVMHTTSLQSTPDFRIRAGLSYHF